MPGVLEAKVAGARMIGIRTESIVIYCETAEAQARVLNYVRGMHLDSVAGFLPETPPMTEAVIPGVSVGEQPLRTTLSFGDVRSRLIQTALQQSVHAGEGEAQFIARVMEAMRRSGINPDLPHMNAPPAP
jgi:hypothetical protein